ncbi:DsbA family protein [Hyphobacterium sp. CCMP332]|uniref:DsbA family protein n=1 Tax=Hyphobacterium sp. CCMP332 TaxID=2749086 RepID=UPI0016508CD2|nr:DsbA family protein [Hyphobacterium sp. CCMP332]QNL18583.1 DsbA family protein [Hyphobacterium sp. CCMP332]
MKAFFAALTGLFAMLVFAAPATAQSDSEFTEAERAEIESMIGDYILENPEIIEEALIELQRRARQRESEATSSAIRANADLIYSDARDPSIGPDDAPIVIVEFMDYKCGYCRIASEWVAEARQAYGDQIRFVFKEYPILGEESRVAARAALAALRQGEDVYWRFHTAMVQSSGPLPQGRIENFARLAGVNVPQMLEDMDDPAIQQHIEQVYALGRAIGAEGTPFFIINGRAVPGANRDMLDELLAAELSRVRQGG